MTTIHQQRHYYDPSFLHEEGRFRRRERASLRAMENHRRRLRRDLEAARELATRIGVTVESDREKEQR
jgi:hypothetical protein